MLSPDDNSTHSGMLPRMCLAALLVLVATECRSVVPVLPNLGSGPSAQGPSLERSGPSAIRSTRPLHDRRPKRLQPGGADQVSSDEPALTVAVVSDMNGSYGSTDYSGHVHAATDWITERLQPDLVLSTGDHVAGQRRGLDYGAMWDAFHRVVTGPLEEAGIPFAPTPGNHDASAADLYERERSRYVREWNSRRPDVDFVGTGNYPLHYAFDIGSVRFVSLDATVSGRLPDRQMAWLRSVLAGHPASATTIVYSHLPLAPFAESRTDEIIGDRELARLLDKEGVDVMLSGHHHAYYPGRRGDVKLIGLACLGGGSRKVVGTDRKSRHSALVMQVTGDGEVRVEARWGPSMNRRVDRTELPRDIRHDGWHIRRIGTGRVPRATARN